MKKDGLTNTFGEKVEKTTLKGCYESLPEATYPKQDMINDLVGLTGKSSTSVRNWIYYGMKPASPEHREIVENYVKEKFGVSLVWTE